MLSRCQGWLSSRKLRFALWFSLYLIILSRFAPGPVDLSSEILRHWNSCCCYCYYCCHSSSSNGSNNIRNKLWLQLEIIAVEMRVRNHFNSNNDWIQLYGHEVVSITFCAVSIVSSFCRINTLYVLNTTRLMLVFHSPWFLQTCISALLHTNYGGAEK